MKYEEVMFNNGGKLHNARNYNESLSEYTRARMQCISSSYQNGLLIGSNLDSRAAVPTSRRASSEED